MTTKAHTTATTAAPAAAPPPTISAYTSPWDCPAAGGATSTYTMNSTVTMVLTAYQYWHMKIMGHHPGSVT